MKITQEEDLDHLEGLYRSGPVHEVLMELKRMRHERDVETDTARRAEIDRDIIGWAGGLPELIWQHERE